MVVGNLTASSIDANLTSFTYASGGEAKLDNCIIRSFQKNLGGTSGNASDICSLQNTFGTYAVELTVVQSVSTNSSIAKTYKFSVRNNATANAWQRLVPLTSSLSSGWGVEMRVGYGPTTTLRLVRLGTSATTTNIECTLTVYQSRADPVTISPLATANTGVAFSTTLYETTCISQVRGNVGIGTDNPTSTLTVVGGATVDSLVATNTVSGTSVGTPDRFLDTTVLSQGAYMSWNHSLTGYTDFVCKRGGGGGGFNFYLSNSDFTSFGDGKTLLATLDSNGIRMTQGIFAAPGSIVGTMFANGNTTGMGGGVVISPTQNSRTTTIYDNAWVTVATFTYTPKSTNSRLFIHFDIYYLMNGSSGDTFGSRITVDNSTENTFVKDQEFKNEPNAGTRSGTIFPQSLLVKNEALSPRTIRIQVNLALSDDTLNLSPNDWTFELLERQT